MAAQPVGQTSAALFPATSQLPMPERRMACFGMQLHFVLDLAMALRAADAVHAVQAR